MIMDRNQLIGLLLLALGIPAIGAALIKGSRITAATQDALWGGGGLMVVVGAALAGGLVRWI